MQSSMGSVANRKYEVERGFFFGNRRLTPSPLQTTRVHDQSVWTDPDPVRQIGVDPTVVSPAATSITREPIMRAVTWRNTRY